VDRGVRHQCRAKPGVHGLNRWTVKCLDLSRFSVFHTARNAPSEDSKFRQRLELRNYEPDKLRPRTCLEMSRFAEFT